ncbi:hypothetical protein HPP92_019838 [Vanilla planifolia]|uniref:Uncharacterized protein n=1 Tax=Vanilla planifolia TaxID=51239 RepID=A0A835Q641_VANPL|nr:hypothetical protein HPP92_019838 [Vanilla planifolia]
MPFQLVIKAWEAKQFIRQEIKPTFRGGGEIESLIADAASSGFVKSGLRLARIMNREDAVPASSDCSRETKPAIGPLASHGLFLTM